MPKMRSLETERLVLRELHQDDLQDVIAWDVAADATSAGVVAQQFLNFCFKEYFKWGMGPWGMLLKQTGSMVGNCSFCHIDLEQLSGEVNYYVAPQHRGQGFATEALKAALEFGFSDLGLRIIAARCDLDNRSSERVMQKSGLVFDRMIRSTTSSGDRSSDEKLYAIVRPAR
jgi:ribosomal-protein-alanine N-acetyltransferase